MKNKEKKHVNKLSRLVDSNIESLTRIYKEAVKDLQLKLFTYEKHEATYTNINNLIKELDTTINQYDKKLYGYVNGENQDKGLTENSYMEGIKSSSKLLSVKGNFTNVNHRAIAFMQGYTFNLIKDINDNLRINLRKSLQLGILKGDSIPDIAKSIVTYLGEEIETIMFRAEMIARTETSRAFTRGTVDKYQEYGIKKVRWVTDNNPCPVCIGLKNLVFYIDNIPFGGPPAHPNCVCTLIPAGDDEAVHDNIVDYFEKVAENNNKVYTILRDSRVNRANRIDTFGLLRNEEIKDLNKAELEILVNKGLGLKELYDPRTHTAKHGRELGLDVPENKKDIIDKHMIEFSRKLRSIKKEADKHITFRDTDRGHVQYGFIKSVDDDYVDIVIYNEKTNMDVTAWRMHKKGLKIYIKKNKYISLDFSIDDL